MPSFLIMGGAAASETLKGGYICTIGGCSTPPKQPRENPGCVISVLSLILPSIPWTRWRRASSCAVVWLSRHFSPGFSLGCFGGVLHPPIVQIYPPFSVSEAAAPPIIKNDGMQSRSVFNNYYRTVIHMQVHSIGSTIASLLR